MVFIHEPHIPDAEFVVDGLPPLEECPCTISPCPRCEQGRGGVARDLDPPQCPGASPAEVWSGYHANLEKLDLLLLAPLASGRMRADFLPEHVERLLHWVGASPQGGLSRGAIFAAWRRWQLGRPCWSIAHRNLAFRNSQLTF